MENLLLVVAGFTGAALLSFVLLRAGRSRSDAVLSRLQETLESTQRQMLLQQRESERLAEQKTASLRNELAGELQTNRREMQSGLIQGFQQMEKVQTQLAHLSSVGRSIQDLNDLLKLPHLRGGFGEATLERLLSDFMPIGSFEMQYRIVPTSTERVDAVIKYPTCVLPIDSKFPREQILPLFETSDPAQLDAARHNLTSVMKTLARSIREKYIHPEHGTTEMALLFVPSETLYFEILRNVRLCEELGRCKVFAVSPNTLAVTLQAVSASRAYYEMARGVEKTITELKKARGHFENFERRFDEVGSALAKAQNAFDTATTHLTRYDGAVARLSGVEPGVSLGTSVATSNGEPSAEPVGISAEPAHS